jgi:hypothetical protein
VIITYIFEVVTCAGVLPLPLVLTCLPNHDAQELCPIQFNALLPLEVQLYCTECALLYTRSHRKSWAGAPGLQCLLAYSDWQSRSRDKEILDD